MSTSCFPDRWTVIKELPVSGIYADAFADAERQLREKYPEHEGYPSAFQARGDVILFIDRGQLGRVKNETATTTCKRWKVKFQVLLMDASQPIVSVEFEIDGSKAKMRWETEYRRKP